MGNLVQSLWGHLCNGRRQTSALTPTRWGFRYFSTNSHLSLPSQHHQPASCEGKYAKGSLRQKIADACREKLLVSMVTGDMSEHWQILLQRQARIFSPPEEIDYTDKLQTKYEQYNFRQGPVLWTRWNSWYDSSWVWGLWVELCPLPHMLKF